MVCKDEEQDKFAPAWGGRDPSFQKEEARARAGVTPAPVYMNVEGHFACLLLDDDTPPQPS